MKLLKNGEIIDQEWTYVDGDAVALDHIDIVMPLETFLETSKAVARSGRVAVRLEPEQDPRLLEDRLDKVAMIEVHFPKYRDGRGYSTAAILREDMGFAGELRAIGDILKDQYHFLIRVGFDVLETTEADPEKAWAWSKNLFPHAYQLSSDAKKTSPVWQKRC